MAPPVKKKEEEEISAAESTRRLDTLITYTYAMLVSGRLKGRKENGRWLVSASAVEKLRALREQRRA